MFEHRILKNRSAELPRSATCSCTRVFMLVGGFTGEQNKLDIPNFEKQTLALLANKTLTCQSVKGLFANKAPSIIVNACIKLDVSRELVQRGGCPRMY